MKFTDLCIEKQQMLLAFTQGETVQLNHCMYGWIDTCDPLHDLNCHSIDNLRIKPKEPVTTYGYTPLFNDGSISYKTYQSILEINGDCNYSHIHSYIQKIYHNGVFVKAEIIPKLELSLKGLI